MATNVLWIGDLDATMDEHFLRASLGATAEYVVNIKIIKNKTTGTTQGYGFIEFRDDQSALKTLHGLNGKPMPGTNPPRRWKLNMAHQGRDNPLLPDFAIFIGDLEYTVDDLQLFNFFSARYSSVKSARVVVDESGQSKGYGFVRFAEEIDQQRALNEMQGVSISNKPIRVSIAAPKNKSGPTPEQIQQMQSEQLANYYASYVHYASYYQQWQQQQMQHQQPGYDQYYQQYYQQYYPHAATAGVPAVPPVAVQQSYGAPVATAPVAVATIYGGSTTAADEAAGLVPHDQKRVDTSMAAARRFLDRSKEIDRSYSEVWTKLPGGNMY